MAISLSAGVRQALSSLQSTQADARIAQSRLATGKKVNSALDNPTSFFTASGLSNRAGDLSKLLDSMGQAIKTLEAADKGVKAITKLVENAQSIVKQAQAAPVDAAATSAAAAKLTATNTAPVGGAAAAGDLIVKVGSKTVTVSLTTAADDATKVATAINTAGGSDFTAAVVGGKIVITAGNTTDSVTIDASSDNTALTATGFTSGQTANATAATAASTKRADLKKDLDGIMSQIDQLASDSGYNGVNLVNGDNLTVQFNESAKSKLDITGKALTASGLSLNSLAIDTNTNIDSALTSLKTATDTLRSQSSTWGANLSVVQNRQDFTKGMIDTLNNGADELTVADANQEGANLLALNTRAQLSQTALSLSSQQDQAVLRLF